MAFWRWLQAQLGISRGAESDRPREEHSVPCRATEKRNSPAPAKRDLPTKRVVASQATANNELLQFSGNPKGHAIDVVVGFDFGTSCAKGAIQTPYALGGRTMFVSFGNVGHRSSRYLLPAAVYRDDADQWYLSPPPGHYVERRAHLKLPLLGEIRSGEAPNSESTTAAIAFVALALRLARAAFLESQAAIYGSVPLRWALNLGVPSAGYDDEHISARFLLLARAAWNASLSAQVTSPRIQKEIENPAVGIDDDVPIAVVPEVAAEMVGYARSKFRRTGLHAVFDIGASTLDVCGINLFGSDGDDTYELLTADVQDLGLLALHGRRREMFPSVPSNMLPDDIVGPLGEPPITAAHNRQLLMDCDSKYIEDTAKTVIRTLAWLRKCRAPDASAWRDGLPLFVTGGAAAAPIVQSIVKRVDQIADSIWVNYNGIYPQPLPMSFAEGPPLGDAVLSRMAVAYGLSFPEINIGKIVPPHEIPNVYPAPLPRRDWQRSYVSKEAV